MDYNKLGNSSLKISEITLGTWVFGGDEAWWGKQNDNDSFEVLNTAIANGINLIDTAPVYGRGRSEKITGQFLKKENIRDKVFIATKVGLSWDGPKIFHNNKRTRILEEVNQSLERLQTNYIDLYQVHWPDSETPIEETALTMKELYDKGIIKNIGVSNFNIQQMQEFMKYSPLHSLQPPYNMFERSIEDEIIPFCTNNNIGIISYIPLQQGILSGKYFSNIKPVGKFRIFSPDLNGKRVEINSKIILDLKQVAEKNKMSLAQLAINWVISQKGIQSVIVGSRKKEQIIENIQTINFKLSENDLKKIDIILNKRLQLIKS